MKKSLTRILSLVLVLVMMLGVMPVVSAADATIKVNETKAIVFNDTLAEGETFVWSASGGNLGKTGNSNEATNSFSASAPGTYTITCAKMRWNSETNRFDTTGTSHSYTISVTDDATGIEITGATSVPVNGTITLAVAATPAGADLPEGTVTWESSDPTKATVSGGVVTGVAEGSATITATLGDLSAQATVTVTKAEINLTGTASDFTMKVGEAKSVTVGMSPANAPGKITYASSNADIVAVNSVGALTAKKEGTATITATLTLDESKADAANYVLGAKATMSWTVTVEDGAVIECADTSSLSTSGITLSPTLKLNGTVISGATFTATASSGLTVTSTDNKTFYVTKTGGGIGYGTVTFVAGGFTGSDGQPYEGTVTKTVNVSFYTHNSIDVTMADGITTLDFNEAADLKAGLFDTKVALVSRMLANVASNNGSNKVYFTVNQANISAQLDLISAGGAANWVNQGGLGSVNLNLKTSSGGTYSFSYKICENGNDALIYGTGNVTVTFGKGESISYSTETGKKVTFKETDFATFWTKTGMTANTMDYVVFGVVSGTSSPVPSQGSLYNNATTHTASYMVSYLDKYAITPGVGEKDLGGVTYMASAYNTAPHTVEIPFTIYGTIAGQSVSGTVQIKVNHTAGNIYSRGVVMGAKGYEYDDLIANTYKSETGLDLYYVEFTIPSVNYGRLYNSIPVVSGNSRVASAKVMDRYEPCYYTYQTGKTYLSNVAFVPAAGFSGKVTLSYTAYDINKAMPKTGTLELNVISKTKSEIFTDVTAKNYSWASDSVDFLYYEGTAQGSNGKYNPSANITRRDFMLMLYRAFLAEDYGTFAVSANFPDVVKGADAYSKEIYQAVGVAKYLGIAQGTNNKFNPTANITRQEAMVLIYRTLETIGKDLDYSSGITAASLKDYAKVSSWAATAISNLVSHGVIKGNNDYIKPASNITRAEMAAILHRVITY